MQKLLISLIVLLPLCARAAELLSLAEAAERFAERSASLPEGSVQAQSIDRKIPLGNCSSGWVWSFPNEVRTTVQVSCTTSATSTRRFVAVRYPFSHSRAESSSSSVAQQKYFVVATRDLPIGTVLTIDDLDVVEVAPKERAFTSTLSDPAALVGLALTRSVRQGEPLGRADARSVQIVKRNTPVTAWSSFPGGRVVAKLTALQNGKVGEWIEVENPQSGRRLRGQVQADGTVKIHGSASMGPAPQAMTTRVD